MNNSQNKTYTKTRDIFNKPEPHGHRRRRCQTVMFNPVISTKIIPNVKDEYTEKMKRDCWYSEEDLWFQQVKLRQLFLKINTPDGTGGVRRQRKRLWKKLAKDDKDSSENRYILWGIDPTMMRNREKARYYVFNEQAKGSPPEKIAKVYQRYSKSAVAQSHSWGVVDARMAAASHRTVDNDGSQLPCDTCSSLSTSSTTSSTSSLPASLGLSALPRPSLSQPKKKRVIFFPKTKPALASAA